MHKEEKGNITTNSNAIQWAISEYLQSLRCNKLENLENVGRFVNSSDLSIFTQEATNYLQCPKKARTLEQ
jgi:hypothetical protein